MSTTGNVVIIQEEGPGVCMICGETEETRPYGPGGIEVCYNCGMKDEAEAERRFHERMMKGDK